MSNSEQRMYPNNRRFSIFISFLTSFLTLVTFGIAINTPPISGSFCIGPCIEYPYLDIASRYPRDYIWMFPAIVLNIVYLVLFVCIHSYARPEKKLYGMAGLSFATISAAVLIVDYFVQITVIQPSIVNGETDGISLLTQYNPHGLFIALEEIGYIMMSFSFLAIAPVFLKSNQLENSVRWILIVSFILSILSLIFLSITRGINRGYIFEIVVISINWLALVIIGILLGIMFRNR